MTVVADASAFLDYLLHTGRAPAVSEVIETADLHVPALCDVEVAAGLRRAVQRKVASEQHAQAALHAYLDLPITRHGHAALLRRTFDLRANFTAYDATYAALAEQLGAELLTTDDGLARAARTHLDLRVTSP